MSDKMKVSISFHPRALHILNNVRSEYKTTKSKLIKDLIMREFGINCDTGEVDYVYRRVN